MLSCTGGAQVIGPMIDAVPLLQPQMLRGLRAHLAGGEGVRVVQGMRSCLTVKAVILACIL